MKQWIMRTIIGLSVMFSAGCIGSENTSLSQTDVWPAITSECKLWTYWWWMASAVDKQNITSQLETFQKAGLGGVHIIPIYGAKGYEDRYIQYLSPEWMEMLDWTVREGRRLGMGVDMTLGTGWCFGGPTITAELANAVLERSIKTVEADKPVTLSSKLPLCVMAYGPDEPVDLTDKVKADGTLDWIKPEGEWKVYELWQKPSGRKVKRAAPGGEGHMLNPFYRAAMENYLGWFDAAFKDYKGLMPRATYHDSYEYVCNWSPDLLTEFEKRRGYRLQDHLPAFFGEGDSDITARLKGDYRRTISEMLLDSFELWAGWSHDKGCITRNEAHGAPTNLLDFYAMSDSPETEFFRFDRNPLVAKFASSAAHVAGRARTSAETGTWLKEHYHVTLGALKNFIDGLFVSGINHVFYHGNCYSPADAPWPGWVFYASTQMNPRNSIWHDVDALNAYLARCQAVLQAGSSDNDILVYWPIHDYWHNEKGMNLDMTIHGVGWLAEQPVGQLAAKLWKEGYTFDYISDDQLLKCSISNMAVVPDTNHQNRIVTPGGAYEMIVVPACTRMPLETFKTLYTLAEQGGVILFEKDIPRDVPGLSDLKEKRAELKSLVNSLTWSPSFGSVQMCTIGKGLFGRGKDINSILNSASHVINAFSLPRETMTDKGLKFTRRRDKDGYWYFIINQDEQFTEEPNTPAFDGWITLARPAQSMMLMDPMTGRSGTAPVRVSKAGNADVYVQLPAGASIILRAFIKAQPEGKPWVWYKEADSTELSGTWEVEFIEGGPELPPAYRTEQLESWTQQGEQAQRFAGTARYRLTFDIQKIQVQRDAWRLDLGTVAASARVRLNGRELDRVFSMPYVVYVPDDLVKRKGNLLEIEVTNLSANRIRDLDIRGVDWKYFRDINIVNIDYKKLDASGWEILDSGLLGPVRLIGLREYHLQNDSL
ncbi:MAG: hypothetical protein LLF76_01410 [Planctomycetaceae bacterium]|nr:hypothetical protein [Planctomycetaceae bacterium]